MDSGNLRLLKLLLRRKIINRHQLARQVLKSLKDQASTGSFLGQLVKVGLITQYQVDMIQQGNIDQLLVNQEYVLLDRLSRGGMGEVWKARHVDMGQPVALKRIRADLQGSTEANKRLLNEAWATASIDHPNVVPILHVGRSDGEPFLVTKFIEGPTLQTIVASRPLSVEEVCRYGIHAARGLAAIHSRGVIHRDVTPSNLIVDRTGALMVLDLGIAQIVANAGYLTGSNVCMGTFDYLSPEQCCDARSVTPQADVCSLGNCLFYFSTRRPPFLECETIANKMWAHLNKVPPQLRTFRPDIPLSIEELYLKMVAKEPELRPSMSEVINVLTDTYFRGLSLGRSSFNRFGPLPPMSPC